MAGAFTVFQTLGFQYYIGYTFPASVRTSLLELKHEEAKDYYKIIYIKQGPCHFLLNDKEFILTGASVICLNERDHIDFLDIRENEVSILWFKPYLLNGLFSFESINSTEVMFTSTEYQDIHFLRQFLHEAKNAMKILSLHTIDSTTIETKLHLTWELLKMQNTNRWPCRSRSYILEILFCLARQEEDEYMANSLILYDGGSRLAIDVIYYLQTCYNKKITIERLAEEFHTNRTTLLTDFKKYTGQSINSYLIQLRVMMASAMLRDTELCIEEICERTGFSDISYFSKLFKKKVNYTPSEYRKINHKT